MGDATLNLGEISDRLEIQDVLARYCQMIDRGDWAGFRALFTDDAQLDFTAFGGPKGDVETVVSFTKAALAQAAASHHMVSTVVIDLDGDRATVRSAAHVPIALALPEGGEHTFFSGLWYNDVFVRTAQGWRIATRRQERAWSFNMPAALAQNA